jgi:hypothetical protein
MIHFLKSLKRIFGINVPPTYHVKILNRGEQINYSDADITLDLEITYIDGNRIYCSETEHDETKLIKFKKRASIIKNLCDYFDSMRSPIILVIEETDKDRLALENYFAQLILKGYRITVEYDSPERRAESYKVMQLELLKAGKSLTINGIKFDNAEQYLEYYKSSKNTDSC